MVTDHLQNTSSHHFHLHHTISTHTISTIPSPPHHLCHTPPPAHHTHTICNHTLHCHLPPDHLPVLSLHRPTQHNSSNPYSSTHLAVSKEASRILDWGEPEVVEFLEGLRICLGTVATIRHTHTSTYLPFTQPTQEPVQTRPQTCVRSLHSYMHMHANARCLVWHAFEHAGRTVCICRGICAGRASSVM